MTRVARWRTGARAGILALLAGILAVALAACAGLPVSGPVKLGRVVTEADDAPDVSFNPEVPFAGMTPQQVVEGFIDAGTGPRNNWAVARMFLTEGNSWMPNTGVTVYAPGQRTALESADGEVQVSLTPEASVDGTGAYSAGGGPPVTLTYRLEQVDGEWRISEAPDGIVLDRNRFASVFRSYSLMFFDPTWTYLVPDQRWFTIEYARVRIAETLTGGGPSPWLAESVKTAFTESTELAVSAVPVRSQVAEVSLRTAARDVDQLTLGRMQTQLEESLETAGVASVEMLVDGQPLLATGVLVRDTRIEPRPLILAGAQFGFLSGSEIEPIPGLGAALQRVEATAIEVDADRVTAAVRTASDEVWRVRGDGTWKLDTRPGLIDPTLDTAGYIYSVPADAPSALLAFGPDGTPSEIVEAWPGATRIYAMRVSRDGTRVAALVRDGIQPSVWIAAIVRDESSGVPVRLGERQVLGELPGDGIDLAWLDGSTLALLTESEEQRFVFEQPVGGAASFTRAPIEARTIAGGNGTGEVRLLDATGQLFSQRGATWTPIATEVTVLAAQQGAPD